VIEHTLEQLPRLAQRWRARELSGAAYAASYFLHWQWALHGNRAVSRRSKSAPRPQLAAWLVDLADTPPTQLEDRLLDFLGDYQYFGVIPNVAQALSAWLRGLWSLQACEHIPTPLQVLEMQTQGTRPVTLISSFPRLLEPVLSKANAHAFMVHDLEHAYKFNHETTLHLAQQAFFKCLWQAERQGRFAAYADDSEFSKKFDYLISDMNTHPAHSTQYLRAILVERVLKSEGKVQADTLSPAGCREIQSLLHATGLDAFNP